MLLSLFHIFIAASFPLLSTAQGDYPCSLDADCVEWAGQDGAIISANSQCVKDPVDPTYGYCGYVGAQCGQASDCDFGSCQDGICRGYYGETCTDEYGCLAYLQCGTDSTCGGPGALAVYEEDSCTSQKLNSDGTCASVPTSGMPNGTPCASDGVCTSGFCSNDYLCADEAPPAGPSQLARRRARDFGLQSYLYAHPAKAYSANRCSTGLVSCPRFGLGASARENVKKKSKTGAWTPTLSYECVDIMRNVESCGGCPGSTTVVDCTEIPFVDAVLCSQGHCLVQSCYGGRVVSPDGSFCI
ncbi:hypothetical protein BT69DRAFT_1350264 [Atractiella rhizophila]|nr:hypothetical protein BT69DRAFT_1350264 [Atractiella rhizophila]